MAKVVISEERLNRIIEESIIETINEAVEDEGLGHALGNAYQWARNKWNNFKGDFNAGRNYQRYQNVNYDPYSKYNNGDEFRNLNGQEYATQRYNNTVTRNANARQWTRDKIGQDTQGQPAPQQQNQIEPTGNPNVTQTAPQAQPATAQTQSTATQGGTPKSAPNGNMKPGNNTNTRNNVVNKAQQILQQKSNFLKQKGFNLVNGQWIYTKDGSNSPALQSQYPDIVQAAKSYNMALKGARGMYEGKIKSLKKQLNEIKKSLNNNKKTRK
jgi:hypothetical protein